MCALPIKIPLQSDVNGENDHNGRAGDDSKSLLEGISRIQTSDGESNTTNNVCAEQHESNHNCPLLHLKSNLSTHGNAEIETAKNIRKREVSIQQLLVHIHDVIETVIPSIKGLIIGGDFNANHDQAMFAPEKTLDTLTSAAYRSVFEGIPFEQRITHPGSHGFSDAMFDYLFGKNVRLGKPIITQTNVSDHLPVTCDVVIQ
jgi:hypothetical protein